MSPSPKPPRSNQEELEERYLGVLLFRSNGPGPGLENVLDFSWPLATGLPAPTSRGLFLGCSVLAGLKPQSVCCGPSRLWVGSELSRELQTGVCRCCRHAPLGHQPSGSFDSVCQRRISGTSLSTLCSASWREDPRLPSRLCKKPESVFHSKLPQIPGSVTKSCQFFLLKSFLSPSSSLYTTATCYGLSHQGLSPGLQLIRVASHLSFYSPGLFLT